MILAFKLVYGLSYYCASFVADYKQSHQLKHHQNNRYCFFSLLIRNVTLSVRYVFEEGP